MKLIIKKTGLLALACLLSWIAGAQSLRSMYFLEGVTLRHKMNPAFMAERNYISVPGMGSITSGAQGNVGPTDFIYKYNDPTGRFDLTTFMSPSVGRDEFLARLNSNNRAQLDADVTLLAFGFHSKQGFNSFEFGWRSNVVTTVPYELFDFMKSGMDDMEGASYIIRNARVVSDGYFEIAYGHAWQISKRFAFGAKWKVLLAGGYLDANLRGMRVTKVEDQWQVSAFGTLEASASGVRFKTSVEENDQQGLQSHLQKTSHGRRNYRRIDGFDLNDSGINGWGLGIDLGADWKASKDLSLSLALTDLGFITWKTTLVASTPRESYTFDGFRDIALNNGDPNSPNDLDDQFEKLGDDLADLVKFYDRGRILYVDRALCANIKLGAEFKMPFYRKWSTGILWSTRFNPIYTWTEGRVSANFSPMRWFDLSVSYGLSNLTSSVGWVMNFHPKGINFFIGSDQMILRVNSNGIPLNDLSAGIFMGLNVTFGKLSGKL